MFTTSSILQTLIIYAPINSESPWVVRNLTWNAKKLHQESPLAQKQYQHSLLCHTQWKMSFLRDTFILQNKYVKVTSKYRIGMTTAIHSMKTSCTCAVRSVTFLRMLRKALLSQLGPWKSKYYLRVSTTDQSTGHGKHLRDFLILIYTQ